MDVTKRHLQTIAGARGIVPESPVDATGPECYRHRTSLQRRTWDAAEAESAESPRGTLDPKTDYSKTAQGN